MKNFRSAVVLCGGKGTRLGVLGKKIPKAMVKIQGKEIIWYIIKILKRNKFNQIILHLGYKGNMIKKKNKKYRDLFSNVDLVDTGESSNNSKFAKKLTKYCDIYINDAFSASHRKHASIDNVTKLLPSGMGKNMENEIVNLIKFLKKPKKPLNKNTKIKIKLDKRKN